MKYIDAHKLIANLERQNTDKKVIESLIRIITSLQQEQLSEDLNDEIKKFIEEYGYERGEDKLLIAIVARHFFELGKTAREEESK